MKTSCDQELTLRELVQSAFIVIYVRSGLAVSMPSILQRSPKKKKIGCVSDKAFKI